MDILPCKGPSVLLLCDLPRESIIQEKINKFISASRVLKVVMDLQEVLVDQASQALKVHQVLEDNLAILVTRYGFLTFCTFLNMD